MKIREIMRPGAFTIGETDSLGDAYTMMKRARIRHLPVMTGDKLVGMLSERDVLAARARTEDINWWSVSVRAAMQSPVQTAGPDDSLTEVAGRMADARLGAMPVVEHGKLLGLATVVDVLDAEVRSAMAPTPVTQAIASDAMTPYPRTIDADASLADAVAIMVDHHVRHVPVVDATSALVGIISERDVRTAIGDPSEYIAQHSSSRAQYRVRDVMTKPAATIAFDTPVIELARRFANERVGALPVVDRFGALIGIISYVDALRVLAG